MHTEFDGEIVLVASKSPRPYGRYESLLSGFAFAKALSNKLLLRTLRQIDKHTFYYDDVNAFVRNIHRHQQHLVFPYYYSVGSRINYAYVQSICESLGVRFVGPEPYALTVCNDKVLSKDICRLHGLLTPRCAVFYSEGDQPTLDVLQPPLIVKPVFEGDSIGIAQDSVCTSYKTAEAKARHLYSKIMAPVMVEEFINGTEVNICLIQNGEAGYHIRTVALNKQGQVYDYRQKHFRLPLKTYEVYKGNEIAVNTDSILNIAKMLGKLEFMRIDCIISDNTLYCIELTPDADLSIGSALYKSFAGDLNYNGFLRLLIRNAVQNYRSRQTS
jgi:D-alanine-D-alanine ligase